MSGDDVVCWCIVFGTLVGVSVFSVICFKVVDDVGDQGPSGIISVWVPECWLCIHITCEDETLCVGDPCCL